MSKAPLATSKASTTGRPVPAACSWQTPSAKDGELVAQTVDAQKAEAAQNGLKATPNLRLINNHTRYPLIRHGPIEPDALLSAVKAEARPRPVVYPSQQW
ncbi:conserved protein of unknown function [Pseudomonas sp. JV551A1]|uniref:Uncharacterized protein n=1 Tax=Pseudomonas inefficax TaxID=2078786 RepID=A0AAQ1P9R3_9PSED|nr:MULTISPECIES: hypothetical protein [Pseudomonas]SPO56410.1 conserved protein of unknown function [Pseudomonas sp. JV551A1]SPO62469.1 conserved protein of unknown function [Pseudomonas inefficax]